MNMVVIGNGSFGSFFADQVGCEAIEHLPEKLPQIIFLAVPINKLEECLKQIAPKLEKESVVIDLCSVKVMPCKWMLDIIPAGIEIIGAHPLFGPNNSVNRTVALCNVRSTFQSRYWLDDLFKNIGCTVNWMTPEEHDRNIGIYQALAHFMARLTPEFKLDETNFYTPSIESLEDLSKLRGTISDELFNDICKYNPYFNDILKSLQARLQNMSKVLE
jgi:prephenate dehydrogenase